MMIALALAGLLAGFLVAMTVVLSGVWLGLAAVWLRERQIILTIVPRWSFGSLDEEGVWAIDAGCLCVEVVH